jgi:hypothetical protein
MSEHDLIEVSRWQREAYALTHAKQAAQQHGEAFEGCEDDD